MGGEAEMSGGITKGRLGLEVKGADKKRNKNSVEERKVYKEVG